ncbi:hypothetical protein [Nostoc sp.]|uniref:hypothetical protein n=1 Tax=Nostoc sp. TaxID=1180 RepID=UPI002FFA6B17
MKFNLKDALYETLREHGLALSEAMPLAQPLVEKALRCAIINPKFKIELPNAQCPIRVNVGQWGDK